MPVVPKWFTFRKFERHGILSKRSKLLIVCAVAAPRGEPAPQFINVVQRVRGFLEFIIRIDLRRSSQHVSLEKISVEASRITLKYLAV